MISVSELEDALRAALPEQHQRRAAELARLLADALNPISSGHRPVASPGVRPVLEALAGHEVSIQKSLITFGEGSQMGDVTISGDLIEGDSLKVTLNVTAPVSTLRSHEQRNRRAMLQKVRATWVDGLLKRAYSRLPRMLLRLCEEPDAVQRALHSQYSELVDSSRELSPDLPILDLFAQSGESLLILGAPGSGKTTLLLELCAALLDRATLDEISPIPVVFNLSSWSGRHNSLANWMVEELRAKYDVPKNIASTWIAENAVLPLLDGLDEVGPEHRAACVTAINRSADEQLLGLAVCARIQAYENLSVRLTLQRAVVIQPLSPEQVDLALAGGGDHYLEHRALLRVDPELGDLATTPLMLNIIALTGIGGAQPEAGATTLSERRSKLFSTYIVNMFRRGKAPAGHVARSSLQWLRWVARCLHARGQSVFLLDQLEADWLSGPAWVRRYTLLDRIGGGLLFGLVVAVVAGGTALALRDPLGPWFWGLETGIAAALCVGLFGSPLSAGAPFSHPLLRYSLQAAIGATIIGVGVGIVLFVLVAAGVLMAVPRFDWHFGMSIGVNEARNLGVFGLLVGLLAGTPGLGDRRVGVIEALDWSWSRSLRAMGVGFGMGLVGGAFDQLLFQLFGGLMSGSRPEDILRESLTIAILGALLGGLMGGPVSSKVEAQVVPNQGVRRSARSAVLAGLVSALVCGFGYWLTLLVMPGSQETNVSYLLRSLQYGLMGAVIASCAYGGYAVIAHIALRIALAWEGSAPLNIVAFLNEASERVLMTRVGAGYIFAHRMLAEHIADLTDGDLERLCAEITGERVAA